MVKKKMSLNSAYKLVWDARECVRPNPGFWRQLRALEKQLVDSGGPLDSSFKLDETKDRKASQNIESLDSESRLVPAMGTAVTFQLDVEDSAAARVKLNMRRALPLGVQILRRVNTCCSKAANAIIGGFVQNVDILSPTSVGNAFKCRVVAIATAPISLQARAC
jgi:hypothetical protein